MSGGKLSRGAVVAPPKHVIATTATPTPTYNQGEGWERDQKSELFLLAVTNFVGESTFYEAAGDRDSRFVELVRACTKSDPRWTGGFIGYLRTSMNMRSASIVAAVEYGQALDPANYNAPDVPSRSNVAARVLQRADEPGEMLAYYRGKYGRAIPTWMKRGINEKLPSLYSERAALKYDGLNQTVRLGDVVAITHPKPLADWQRALYKYLLESRYGRGWEYLKGLESASILPTLSSFHAISALPVTERRGLLQSETAPEVLRAAGVDWQRYSQWIEGPMDALAWSRIIPGMGYMALLRNLRNFEQAGVPDAVLDQVARKLSDQGEVADSRQLIFRFYSAYKELESERFARPIEQALEYSIANIPEFPGKTLVLIDTSGSMNDTFSEKGESKRWEMAALFGFALAKRCEHVDLYRYGSNHSPLSARGPILRLVKDLERQVNGGTATWQAVEATYTDHDRIVILTDEQADPYHTTSYDRGSYNRDYRSSADRPWNKARRIYTYNLAGYKAAHDQQGKGNHFAFGGLNDEAFKVMAMLDSGLDTGWPWE